MAVTRRLRDLEKKVVMRWNDFEALRNFNLLEEAALSDEGIGNSYENLYGTIKEEIEPAYRDYKKKKELWEKRSKFYGSKLTRYGLYIFRIFAWFRDGINNYDKAYKDYYESLDNSDKVCEKMHAHISGLVYELLEKLEQREIREPSPVFGDFTKEFNSDDYDKYFEMLGPSKLPIARDYQVIQDDNIRRKVSKVIHKSRKGPLLTKIMNGRKHAPPVFLKVENHSGVRYVFNYKYYKECLKDVPADVLPYKARFESSDFKYVRLTTRRRKIISRALQRQFIIDDLAINNRFFAELRTFLNHYPAAIEKAFLQVYFNIFVDCYLNRVQIFRDANHKRYDLNDLPFLGLENNLGEELYGDSQSSPCAVDEINETTYLSESQRKAHSKAFGNCFSLPIRGELDAQQKDYMAARYLSQMKSKMFPMKPADGEESRDRIMAREIFIKLSEQGKIYAPALHFFRQLERDRLFQEAAEDVDLVHAQALWPAVEKDFFPSVCDLAGMYRATLMKKIVDETNAVTRDAEPLYDDVYEDIISFFDEKIGPESKTRSEILMAKLMEAYGKYYMIDAVAIYKRYEELSGEFKVSIDRARLVSDSQGDLKKCILEYIDATFKYKRGIVVIYMSPEFVAKLTSHLIREYTDNVGKMLERKLRFEIENALLSRTLSILLQLHVDKRSDDSVAEQDAYKEAKTLSDDIIENIITEMDKYKDTLSRRPKAMSEVINNSLNKTLKSNISSIKKHHPDFFIENFVSILLTSFDNKIINDSSSEACFEIKEKFVNTLSSALTKLLADGIYEDCSLSKDDQMYCNYLVDELLKFPRWKVFYKLRDMRSELHKIAEVLYDTCDQFKQAELEYRKVPTTTIPSPAQSPRKQRADDEYNREKKRSTKRVRFKRMVTQPSMPTLPGLSRIFNGSKRGKSKARAAQSPSQVLAFKERTKSMENCESLLATLERLSEESSSTFDNVSPTSSPRSHYAAEGELPIVQIPTDGEDELDIHPEFVAEPTEKSLDQGESSNDLKAYTRDPVSDLQSAVRKLDLSDLPGKLRRLSCTNPLTAEDLQALMDAGNTSAKIQGLDDKLNPHLGSVSNV